MPLLIANVDRDERTEIVNKILDDLEIKHRYDHKPNQISGGEKQRVAIGRALANDPDIILADEPTGNLDSKRGDEVMRIFRKLNDAGRTIVLITHDAHIAKYGHRTIHLRDGRIVKE